MPGEIRCPKCGSEDLQMRLLDTPDNQRDYLACECRRCGCCFDAIPLDAVQPQVRGRENGWYWIRLKTVADKGWEVGYWDGRVWARCADADEILEDELSDVGPVIREYTGG